MMMIRLKLKCTAYLPFDIEILQIGKSVALRIDIPLLELDRDFIEQVGKVPNGRLKP
jgi:hypothetical protein